MTNAGTIGRTAIAPHDDKTSRTTFQKSVAILKPIREIVDGLFLLYGLKANLSNLVGLSAGTAQKNLLLRDIRAFKISMPSKLSMQRDTANNISMLQHEINHLESQFQNKLTLLTELKQSILHQAFTGALTADTNAVDRTLAEAGV